MKSRGPLRAITKAEMWSGHGPKDQWQRQAFWFEYELECGHQASGPRIPALPNLEPAYDTPRTKRVRCRRCGNAQGGHFEAQPDGSVLKVDPKTGDYAA